ncbi:MAG: DUF4160 domain-containing protein [Bosea sp. (in: a-proteobacteria)]
MPTIAQFYGIIISMYWEDHNPPHFHARYGNTKAIFCIADGERLAGELPLTAGRLVQEWAAMRRPELEENWQRAIKFQTLLKIAGPDQE